MTDRIMASQGILVVLSGPSGAGKGTVRRKLLERCRHVVYGVSVTTRPPRPGETDGVDYFFVQEAEFKKRIDRGDFIEWAQVYGNYYGTPREPMMSQLLEGIDVLVEKDVQGALSLMKLLPEAVFVFIAPPSMDALRSRIEARGTEVEATRELRLRKAKEEMRSLVKYDYVVVNDDVNCAVEALHAIVVAEKRRTVRQRHLLRRILEGDF